MLAHLAKMRGRARTEQASPTRPLQPLETAASVSGGVQHRGGGM
jgi:hypothetical protein